MGSIPAGPTRLTGFHLGSRTNAEFSRGDDGFRSRTFGRVRLRNTPEYMDRFAVKRVRVLLVWAAFGIFALSSFSSVCIAEGISKVPMTNRSTALVESRSTDEVSLRCTASNLHLIDRGTDVGGGSWIQLFQVTNRGDQSCSLKGYPSITLAPSQGAFHSLMVISIRYEAARKIGDSRRGPVPTSILSARGGMSSFWIAGSDTPAFNQPGCKMATDVVVTLPAVRGRLRYRVTNIPFNVCEDAIEVTPILPGPSGSNPVEPLSYFDLQGTGIS